MASSLTRRQVTHHTESIQTSKILNLVQDHVLNGTEVERSRLEYGMKLLAKTLPDLRAVEMAVDGSLDTNVVIKLGA
jgi:hypothetical protein